MMFRELPVPTHFDEDLVSKIWNVPYQKRAAEAEEWAKKHEISPSSSDEFRTCLLLIDLQNSFCIPSFELFVAGRTGRGAVDDNKRLCRFIYRNLTNISQIVLTLDTHQVFQIFHSVFLVDENGRHPEPYTLITTEDVRAGRWRISPEACRTLRISREYADRYLLHYVETLERGSKFRLTVWPYHTLLGGVGHALVPSVEEAVFFHSIARSCQPIMRIKGNNPLTEHYSALSPEVRSGPDGELIGALDVELINYLAGFDAIIIAGQAKSHCVAWTVEDLQKNFMDIEPSLLNKIYLLEDCTSPVVVKDAVDYTEFAETMFRKFEKSGMHIVRSTQRIDEWPGITSRA
ncbi:MAG: isochorismatase [Nitrososphaerota archaeon]